MTQRESTKTAEQQADGGIVQKEKRTISTDRSPWLVSEEIDKFGPLVMAFAATLLTWTTAGYSMGLSAGGNVWSQTGLQTDMGKVVVVVVLLVFLASWQLSEEKAGWSRYIGGSLIVLAPLLRLWYHGQLRSELFQEASLAMPEEEAASAVAVNAGVGIWVAIVAGILIVGVERRRRRMAVE